MTPMTMTTTPERWQQIRDVLEKALELAPGERAAFLDRVCSSDQSLRQEVEILLACGDDLRSSFLQSAPRRQRAFDLRLCEPACLGPMRTPSRFAFSIV
jgi:hypothetical protein